MLISYPNGRRASGRKALNAVSLMAFRLWWGYATSLYGRLLGTSILACGSHTDLIARRSRPATVAPLRFCTAHRSFFSLSWPV